VLKNSASRRDPALCGFCKCSHMTNMLRFPKRRTKWLAARCLFFNTLLKQLASQAAGERASVA
jgi:hypothetical protein